MTSKLLPVCLLLTSARFSFAPGNRTLHRHFQTEKLWVRWNSGRPEESRNSRPRSDPYLDPVMVKTVLPVASSLIV